MQTIKPRPVLMIEYTDDKGQKCEINWFDLGRDFRRNIKRKNPTLYAKIHGVAKEMMREYENAVQD